MKRKYYIKFYGLKERDVDLGLFHIYPMTLNTYGFVCTRSYWDCVRLAFKHILRKGALLFIVKRARKRH